MKTLQIRLLAALVAVVFFSSACATGEGPWERSGQRAGAGIGAGLGALTGAGVGAALGGGKGAAIGALIGGVAGGALGSGIGGAVRSSEDPKLLCAADGRDATGAPCLYDTARREIPITSPAYQGYWYGGGYSGGGTPGYGYQAGPQPGRGYFSTEDCSGWRAAGLEEACRRGIARDASIQRNGAFGIGRNGGSCESLQEADLRESCFSGRRLTNQREAERDFERTR